MVDIRTKRAFEAAAPSDGVRILVDRLWPRGRPKDELALDAWNKDVAPSTELREWFGHDADKWDAFVERYREELLKAPEAWEPILEAARKGRVTLVYAARDERHNNAVALRDFLRDQANP